MSPDLSFTTFVKSVLIHKYLWGKHRYLKPSKVTEAVRYWELIPRYANTYYRICAVWEEGSDKLINLFFLLPHSFCLESPLLEEQGCWTAGPPQISVHSVAFYVKDAAAGAEKGFPGYTWAVMGYSEAWLSLGPCWPSAAGHLANKGRGCFIAGRPDQYVGDEHRLCLTPSRPSNNVLNGWVTDQRRTEERKRKKGPASAVKTDSTSTIAWWFGEVYQV